MMMMIDDPFWVGCIDDLDLTSNEYENALRMLSEQYQQQSGNMDHCDIPTTTTTTTTTSLTFNDVDQNLSRQYQQLLLPELHRWIEIAAQQQVPVKNDTTATTSSTTTDYSNNIYDNNDDNAQNIERTTIEIDPFTTESHIRCNDDDDDDDGDDDHESIVVDGRRSLVAILILCGRHPHGYDIIIQILYQYFVVETWHVPSTTTTNTTDDDRHDHCTTRTISNTANGTNLSSFLYRLCRIYLDVCATNCNDNHYRRHDNPSGNDETSTNNGHDTIEEEVPIPVRPPLPPTPKKWEEYFASIVPDSTSHPPPPPTLLQWNHWIRRYAPIVPIMVSTVMSYIYLLQLPPPQPTTTIIATKTYTTHAPQEMMMKINPTNVPAWMSTTTTIPMQLTIMGLGSGSGGSSGEWQSIYQSSKHGLSFTTLTHQLISYYGPTLLIIETTRNEIFGYFTKVPWKVSNRWYTQNHGGNHDDLHHRNDNGDDVNDDDDVDESFLFRLYPSWNIYRPQMESSTVPKRYHQYLNPPSSIQSSSRNNHHNTLLGLAIGGVADNAPRLHITPTFERCTACRWDSVFDIGSLLSNDDESYFDVFTLEVWAVSKCHYSNHNRNFDNNIYEEGKRIGAERVSNIEHWRQRCAKVDRAQFVDDFIHGTVLPSNKLFQHRLQTRGRADFVVASDMEGYVIDGKQPSPR